MELLFFVLLAGYAVKCDESNYYVIQRPVEDTPQRLESSHLTVYWNVPTMQCTSKKIYFENLYEKFGIIQNKGDSFRGEKIAILYDPGFFPALLRNESSGKLRYRNGGVPQEGNLETHLKSFKNVLDQSIPDKDFSGIGIIDFESWRPIFRQNFGEVLPYKSVSYDIERKRHFWWPEPWVTAEAKRRFEESARVFMQTTISVAKQMRPRARWGYYGFPYCFNMVNNNLRETCAKNVHLENDQIDWLWMESTALYPSVYSSKNLTTQQLEKLIAGRIREAVRVRRKDHPILPYFWFRYRDGGYMSEKDLSAALQRFNDSDASGFLIWGSSNDVNTVEKCNNLYKYVYEVMGPAIAAYTKKPRKFLHDEADSTTNTTTIHVPEVHIDNTDIDDDIKLNDTDIVVAEDSVENIFTMAPTPETVDNATNVVVGNGHKKHIVANIDEDYIEDIENATFPTEVMTTVEHTTVTRKIVVKEAITSKNDTKENVTKEQPVKKLSSTDTSSKEQSADDTFPKVFQSDQIEEQTAFTPESEPNHTESILPLKYHSEEISSSASKFEEPLLEFTEPPSSGLAGDSRDDFFLDDNMYYDDNFPPMQVKRDDLLDVSETKVLSLTETTTITTRHTDATKNTSTQKPQTHETTTGSIFSTSITNIPTTVFLDPVEKLEVEINTEYTGKYEFENLSTPKEEIHLSIQQREFKIPNLDQLKNDRKKENGRKKPASKHSNKTGVTSGEKLAIDNKLSHKISELTLKENLRNISKLFEPAASISNTRRKLLKPDNLTDERKNNTINTDYKPKSLPHLANILKLPYPDVDREVDKNRKENNIMSVLTTTISNIPDNLPEELERIEESLNEMMSNTNPDPYIERLINYVYKGNNTEIEDIINSSEHEPQQKNIPTERLVSATKRVKEVRKNKSQIHHNLNASYQPEKVEKQPDTVKKKNEIQQLQDESVDKNYFKDILRFVRENNEEKKANFLVITDPKDIEVNSISPSTTNAYDEQTEGEETVTEIRYRGPNENRYRNSRGEPSQETTTEDQVGGSSSVNRPKYIFCIFFYFYSLSKCLCDYHGYCV